MFTPEHTVTPRRGFLATITTAAAGIGLGGLLPAPVHATVPSADPALEAWFGRIKGAHRQVFDAPEPNEGMPAIWPRIYMNTMNATYGAAAGTTAVVILRHGGLVMALNDAIWSKYSLGAMVNVMDGDKPATRNVYATITGLPIPGLGIVELLKSGVLIGACDVAMTVMSSKAAEKAGLDPAAVKKEWIAGLHPGIQLVPSGVMAVGRAQEFRCTYCFAG